MRRQDVVAVGIAGFLFATVVYRASSQAITHDEALTWQWTLGRAGANPFVSGTSNNHVAFTLLAWVSTRLLGLSEFALRLPTVLASLAYFGLAYRLCRRAFSQPALFFVTFLLLVLNPYVLDYLVAARGYGLALACALWALHELGAWLDEARSSRLTRAGIALGLCVSAHLTFAIFAASVGLAILIPEAIRAATEGWSNLCRRVLALLLRLVAPALLVAGGLVGPLMMRIDRGDFYGGVGSLLESARQLSRKCLAHARHPLLPGEDGWYAGHASLSLSLHLLQALWLASVVVTVLHIRRQARRGTATDGDPRILVLWTAALAWAPVLLVLAVEFGPQLGFRFSYPDSRRALWFTPLIVLGAAALTNRLLQHGPASRWAGRAGLAILAAVVLHFGAQWNTDFLADYRDDAGSRRVFERIEQHRRQLGLPRVRVGLQAWNHEPALNFYRERYGARSIHRITRRFEPDTKRYDYIVLQPDVTPETLAALEISQMLYHDPVSGVWLAYRERPSTRAKPAAHR